MIRKEINALFDTGVFRKIVMGVATKTLKECGFSKARQAEFLYECMTAMDNYTAEEFENAYDDYLREMY